MEDYETEMDLLENEEYVPPYEREEMDDWGDLTDEQFGFVRKGKPYRRAITFYDYDE